MTGVLRGRGASRHLRNFGRLDKIQEVNIKWPSHSVARDKKPVRIAESILNAMLLLLTTSTNMC